MLKAETFKDLIHEMGMDASFKNDDGEYVKQTKWREEITSEQRERYALKFRELEESGMLEPVGDNTKFAESCLLWHGKNNTEYQRLVVSLFRYELTLNWIDHYSCE